MFGKKEKKPAAKAKAKVKGGLKLGTLYTASKAKAKKAK